MKKNLPTDLEKLEAFGSEVVVKPEASLVDKKQYSLNLSDDAFSSRIDFATIAGLFKQKIDLQVYRRENNGDYPPEIVAPLPYQELFLEIIEMAEAFQIVGGHITYLPVDAAPPTIPITITSVQAAAAAGYDVPTEYTYQVFVKGTPGEPGVPETLDHYEDRTRPVKPLDLFLLVEILTEQGPKGDQGDQGEPGPKGDQGEPGSDAICGDCPPPQGGTNPTGPSGPNGGGGGSGPGGAPNPDGNDKEVFIAGCPDPIINFPYCSESFSFANADLRAAIVDAATTTGKFNPSSEELVSCILEWHGAAYGGVAEVTVDTEVGYTGTGGNVAGVLTVTDAAPLTFQVPYEVETFGLPGVLVVQGYHYNGDTGIRLLPAGNPITLTGEMSTYPLTGTGNCNNPPTENDPAWLKVCLRQFVKHSTSVCLPFLYHEFTPGQPWDDWEMAVDEDRGVFYIYSSWPVSMGIKSPFSLDDTLLAKAMHIPAGNVQNKLKMTFFGGIWGDNVIWKIKQATGDRFIVGQAGLNPGPFTQTDTQDQTYEFFWPDETILPDGCYTFEVYDSTQRGVCRSIKFEYII